MPLHFHGPRGQLYGVYHAPLANPVSPVAYLLCPPHGPALVRSHRIFRFLGERLARQGHAVLRFDWSATGESAGECTEGCLRHWRRDVLAADQQLRRLSGATGTAWIGLQLGATAALQAAASAPVAPTALVAWDPVIDGPRWMAGLEDGYARYMRRDFSNDWQRNTTPDAPLEYFGIAVGNDLKSELQALTPETVAATLAGAPQTTRILVLDAGSGTPLDAFVQPDRTPQVRVQRVASPETWNSDESMNTASVPLQTIAPILSFLGAAE